MTPFVARTRSFKPAASAPGFRGWHMVARAFLCQNVATGLWFGTFGTTLLAVQSRFSASRATISLGMGLALLSMGLLSPLTAKMLRLLTLRWTMTCGLALSCAGYAVLAVAPNSRFFLLGYALLIGPGVAMFGPLPSSILVSNWFVTRQGTAMGIMSIPLFTVLAPLASVALLDRYGLTTLYLCLAASHLLLLPVVLTIVERPSLIRQQALGAGLAPSESDLTNEDLAPLKVPLMTRKAFWVMIVGGGTLNAAGIIAISHIVALSIERGMSEIWAPLFVSVIGGTSMLGALLVGLLCDRLGPPRALALVALGYCAAWTCIFMTTWLPVLILAVALHGICAGGVFTGITVFARYLFGHDAMARAIGLFFLLTLPFTFCFPPVAGWIRDVTGSYDVVIVILMVSSGLVSAAFIGVWHAERRHAHRMNLPIPA